MALHTYKDNGDMGWKCPHCGKENTAHISHEQVEHPAQDEIEAVHESTAVEPDGTTHVKLTTRKTGTYIDTSMIALPTCECGTRTFLKASFTQEELEAHNMLEPIFEGDQVNWNVVGHKITESHAIAHRHMALAKQMKELGKRS